MLSKEERKELNTAFWTRFKAQAGKNKGADGSKITWVNYPTHVKQLYIRLFVDTKMARFSIEIQDKDSSIRDLLWDQFVELKKVMENEIGTQGGWEKNAFNDAGFPICRIYWTLEGVNYANKKDQQKIIRFFLDHLLPFDRFYSTYGDILIELMK